MIVSLDASSPARIAELITAVPTIGDNILFNLT